MNSQIFSVFKIIKNIFTKDLELNKNLTINVLLDGVRLFESLLPESVSLALFSTKDHRNPARLFPVLQQVIPGREQAFFLAEKIKFHFYPDVEMYVWFSLILLLNFDHFSQIKSRKKGPYGLKNFNFQEEQNFSDFYWKL